MITNRDIYGLLATQAVNNFRHIAGPRTFFKKSIFQLCTNFFRVDLFLVPDLLDYLIISSFHVICFLKNIISYNEKYLTFSEEIKSIKSTFMSGITCGAQQSSLCLLSTPLPEYTVHRRHVSRKRGICDYLSSILASFFC